MKQIKQCPHCTMPLRQRELDEHHVLTYCDSYCCTYLKETGNQYQRIRTVKKPWEKK